MANSKHTLWIFVILLTLNACSQYEPVSNPDIVVEGWIDAGGHPIVLIHKAYALANSNPKVELRDIIQEQLIPFGRVTVIDGEDSVVLTGRVDTNYMPPYRYSTTEVIGQEGKTYRLRVQFNQWDATATTTIPPIVHWDSLVVYQASNHLLGMYGYLSDVQQEDYFIVMVKKLHKKQFEICPMGVFSGKQAENGRLRIDIHNQGSDSDQGILNKFFFPQNDSTIYSIKMARIDAEAYAFWDSYAALRLSQGNLFMAVFKNVETNINGGLGYWSGMGTDIINVSVDKPNVYYPKQ
ncbi:MAG: DUF4249 family protein [Bacteroidales bacterium]|nr:DUF4249 family protein [Candidatus Colicola equi]